MQKLKPPLDSLPNRAPSPDSSGLQEPTCEYLFPFLLRHSEAETVKVGFKTGKKANSIISPAEETVLFKEPTPDTSQRQNIYTALETAVFI